MLLAARVKSAGASQPLSHMLRRTDGQWHIVDERTATQAAMEELVMIGVGDGAQIRFAIDQQADRHAPVVQAVEKTGGSVDRVDHPHAARRERGRAAFLAEEAILGKIRRQLVADELLDLLVGEADDILRVAFMLDYQRVAIAVVIHAHARRLQRDAPGEGVTGIDVQAVLRGGRGRGHGCSLV